MRMTSRTPLIVTLSIAWGVANAQGSFETKPAIHDDMAVFTAEGDLWLGSISAHTARRITSDPGLETNARFSLDGTRIAFSGQYEGGTDVYVMPVSGGAPKRLTYDPAGAEVQGWTADGGSILFRSRRYSPVGGVRHLFLVPAAGGQSKQLPIPRADFGSYGPDGKIAYVPVSFEWANWFHYQGGGADDVWLFDPNGKSFKRLTEYPGVDTTPVWCGQFIYFISERSGWSNLWRIDPGTKAVKQCTFYNDQAVRYPSSDGKRVIFQHGGSLALYDPTSDKSEELTFELNSDRVHAREQRAALGREVGPATTYTNGGSIGQLGNGVSLGPTGKRILLEARGQIVSVASEAGDMRVLENRPGTRARFPIWSPDGKRFAFVSDRSGENELWTSDAAGGGSPSQLTHGLKANPYPSIWSPDGNWIALADRNARVLLVDAKSGVIKVVDQADRSSAYDSLPSTVSFSPDGKFLSFSRIEPNWLYSVNLYEVSTGKTARVSDTRVNSYFPVFDASGKFIVFLADNSFTPTNILPNGKYNLDTPTRIVMSALTRDASSPFLPKNDEEGLSGEAKPSQAKSETKVDWDGLQDRLIQVPMPASRYAALDAIPGRLLVLDQGENPSVDGPPEGVFNLLSFDLNARKATSLVSGIDGFQRSFDGKKVLLMAGRNISVHDLEGPPSPMGQGAVDLSPYTIAYDPVAEWKQAFEESWRIARDFFYDPNMHGLDWRSIHRKYESQMLMVGDRSDLTRVLSNMVSELNSGHAYITSPGAFGRSQNMGFIGADFEPVGSEGVRIKKLYRGDAWNPGLHSPLLDPGIGLKEGDSILEIAGQRVKSDQDIQALLVGTAGQTVALMVNNQPSRSGARVIRVRPLSSESELRYQDWVMGRTRYVESHGGPNFGYLHIPNMTAAGVIGFTKGQFPDVYKTAMIYDTRYNGGGYVSSLLLQDIGASPTAWFKPRFGEPWTREGWAVIGHRVALCNEYNFSDGELFIEAWKRMKIGPVVGKRTGGGEVGSGGGYELIDHGSIFVPNYGAYYGGEWMIEGKGAGPTVEVDQDPTAVMDGKDPQLDRAIEILKEELSRSPITIPQHPPFPIKAVTPH